MIKTGWAVAAVVICLFAAARADALERGKYGLGVQSTHRAWGFSGMYDVDEDVSLQAVIGSFGRAHAYVARGLYRFRREEAWNAYGYGMVGIWTHRHPVHGRDTAPGLGAGVGLEYDWRDLKANLPPLFWNVEIGLAATGLDHHDISTVFIGAGVHYRF